MDFRLPQSPWHSLWWDFLAILLFITCIVLGAESVVWLIGAVPLALFLGFRAWRRR
jgi:hypothetical protein